MAFISAQAIGVRTFSHPTASPCFADLCATTRQSGTPACPHTAHPQVQLWLPEGPAPALPHPGPSAELPGLPLGSTDSELPATRGSSFQRPRALEDPRLGPSAAHCHPHILVFPSVLSKPSLRRPCDVHRGWASAPGGAASPDLPGAARHTWCPGHSGTPPLHPTTHVPLLPGGGRVLLA